jgi:hypothetical protein
MVEADDFPEGEEDDDDEEGSVAVIEGKEGFVAGLELSRILADLLERYFDLCFAETDWEVWMFLSMTFLA